MKCEENKHVWVYIGQFAGKQISQCQKCGDRIETTLPISVTVTKTPMEGLYHIRWTKRKFSVYLSEPQIDELVDKILAVRYNKEDLLGSLNQKIIQLNKDLKLRTEYLLKNLELKEDEK